MRNVPHLFNKVRFVRGKKRSEWVLYFKWEALTTCQPYGPANKSRAEIEHIFQTHFINEDVRIVIKILVQTPNRKDFFVVLLRSLHINTVKDLIPREFNWSQYFLTVCLGQLRQSGRQLLHILCTKGLVNFFSTRSLTPNPQNICEINEHKKM